MSKHVIEVEVGSHVLHFELDDNDINRYLNEQMPNEKIKSAFNLLSRTVVETDKELFKNIALSDDGKTPKGIVVMQIATVVAYEFGGDLEVTLKKPNNSLRVSSKTGISS